MKWINAKQQVTVTIYDEEQEEHLVKTMTVEEMLDTYTNEGCPAIYGSPEQPESAKEYCAECDHIEVCQWYPYEGCDFRSTLSVQQEQTKMIEEIREWIDSRNRGSADYFIVDKIEDIINKYE